MKKLISIFLVLTLLISTMSCRFQDDDFETDEAISTTELQSVYEKNNDSAKAKIINSLEILPQKTEHNGE
ncbi:hypothetical protein [Chryseobacterium indoltheticum]|uniref:hypothetical protein n=1 Tax=Chryseobacterium indoltheticum TaxID=254 RepID=UPI003F49124B